MFTYLTLMRLKRREVYSEQVIKYFTYISCCFSQSQTMQLMYKLIAEELASQNLVDSHPLDYLNFYCLGNREEIPSSTSQSLRESDKVWYCMVTYGYSSVFIL